MPVGAQYRALLLEMIFDTLNRSYAITRGAWAPKAKESQLPKPINRAERAQARAKPRSAGMTVDELTRRLGWTEPPVALTNPDDLR